MKISKSLSALLALTLSVVLLTSCGVFAAYKAGISIAHSITNSEQAAGHISAEKANAINADLNHAEDLGTTGDTCFKQAKTKLDKVQCVANLEVAGRSILATHHLAVSPRLSQVESIILAALDGLKAYVDSARGDFARVGAAVIADPEKVMKEGMEKMKAQLEALQKQ